MATTAKSSGVGMRVYSGSASEVSKIKQKMSTYIGDIEKSIGNLGIDGKELLNYISSDYALRILRTQTKTSDDLKKCQNASKDLVNTLGAIVNNSRLN